MINQGTGDWENESLMQNVVTNQPHYICFNCEKTILLTLPVDQKDISLLTCMSYRIKKT